MIINMTDVSNSPVIVSKREHNPLNEDTAMMSPVKENKADEISGRE